MTRTHTQAQPLVTVTFRAPRELVNAIDAAAHAEAQRLALPVDRSAILRRLIARELTEPADMPRALGLADPVFPTT